MAIFLGRMMTLSIKTFGETPSEKKLIRHFVILSVSISTELQRITDERRTMGNEPPKFSL
jgi:hypothetical protein